MAQGTQVCHCEAPTGPWQSHAGSCDFADGFPVVRPCSARLPRRFAPRNDTSGAFTIITIGCSDRQHCGGAGCPLPYNGVCGRRQCAQICCCQRRSLTAATDAIGFYVFNGSLYELQVPSRDCTPRALPRASRSGRHVGLWPPRNDNSGAITVLSSAGTNRKRCAGSGMPLPYNARLAVLRNFPFSILHFPFAPCLAPTICTAFHNKKLPHPGGCGSGAYFLLAESQITAGDGGSLAAKRRDLKNRTGSPK